MGHSVDAEKPLGMHRPVRMWRYVIILMDKPVEIAEKD